MLTAWKRPFGEARRPEVLKAVSGLGHTAAEQVAAGQLSADQAEQAYRDSTLAVFGIPAGKAAGPPAKTRSGTRSN